MRATQDIAAYETSPTREDSRSRETVVGPLVTTDSGNNYILTVQDSFTRYLEAFPMRDQTAATVAKHLITGVILRHGVPRQILTDLGTNFMS